MEIHGVLYRRNYFTSHFESNENENQKKQQQQQKQRKKNYIGTVTMYVVSNVFQIIKIQFDSIW